MRTLLACSLSWGCSSPPEQTPTDTGSEPTPADTDTGMPITDTEPPGSACGEIRVWDLTVRGIVQNEQRVGAPFADVWLEDRGWARTTQVLGSGYTDADGVFEIAITGLTDAENCWGTLLDYVLVAELGPQRGEDGINTYLFNAVQSGTLVADVSTNPLVMEDTSTP
jgi:hypothetical protein